MKEQTLTAQDGTPLHLVSLGDPEASRSLVIVHGYGEHGGRYPERAQTFVDAGFHVLIPDVRGHGKSGGPRGAVMQFDQYLEDLDQVMALTKAPTRFVFGHSHGGLIVAKWLLSRPATVRAAALSSPFFGLSLVPPAWKTVAARALSQLLPRVSLPTEIDPNHVSHDPEVVRAYIADPLNHQVANARWFTEVMAAQGDCLRRASTLSTPTLVLQAGDDRIVSPGTTARWAKAAPAELCTYEEIDGAFHELFFEPDGQRHADRVLQWFDTQS